MAQSISTLPAPLSPWTPHLEIFAPQFRLLLSNLAEQLQPLLFAAENEQEEGEPDGWSEVQSRGSLERLLMRVPLCDRRSAVATEHQPSHEDAQQAVVWSDVNRAHDGCTGPDDQAQWVAYLLCPKQPTRRHRLQWRPCHPLVLKAAIGLCRPRQAFTRGAIVIPAKGGDIET